MRLVTVASSFVLSACAAGWTSTPPSAGATAPAQRVGPAEHAVVAEGLAGTVTETASEAEPAPEEAASAGAERSRAAEARLAALDGQARARADERDAFDYWDRDGDGVLTVEELTDSMIAAWDTNGDGVVDRAEWPG
ncbi:MAG: EF-hand domain-containing protein [Sandaracinaceae bacterium]|nr:EF-hand domain-containing protein [Sandaracinaceae bacterium]